MSYMSGRLAVLFLSSAAITSPALATDQFQGKGKLNFSLSQGNTDVISLETDVETIWRFGLLYNQLDVSYELGYSSGEKNRERTAGSLGVGIEVLPSVITSITFSILADQFAGYEARFLIGAAIKVIPIDEEKLKLWISIAPGAVFEKTIGTFEYVESFAFLGEARLWWKPFERFTLTLDADALYSPSSTITTGRALLEFQLIGSLAAGAETVATYYTNPPGALLDWDVRTGVILTFGF